MRLDLPLYGCILFKNYIKPQQGETDDHAAAGCILFKNYIKPQPLYQRYSGQNVVSYLKTTSNHNCRLCGRRRCRVVSYLKTTSNHNHRPGSSKADNVVSYLKTTSNHNPQYAAFAGRWVVSYLKTTSNHNLYAAAGETPRGCILFKNYIKPQLRAAPHGFRPGCILFKNYIKPQPRALTLLIFDCLQLFCQSKTMCCALRGSRFVRFFRSYRYKYIKKIPIVAAFRAVRARPDPRNSSCRRIACP